MKKNRKGRYFYNFISDELIYICPINDVIFILNEVEMLGKMPNFFEGKMLMEKSKKSAKLWKP